MYNLIIRARANSDAKKAYLWYEDKRVGLGELFIEELQDCYDQLIVRPEAYHKIKFDFRQFNMKRFPYAIVYDIDEKSIVVYTVFHTK